MQKLIDNINRVIAGKQAVSEKIIAALLAEGHVLVEDVPGVGKTTLCKALAKSLELSFNRIQFTPDLMPSDILGVSVFESGQGFRFIQGPVFSQMVLADEINRASPKTQSSLLEVMAEKQVTLEGQAYRMEKPFMVIATQNPVEYEGTFPLPEAQMDRFMIKVSMGYPERDDEVRILSKGVRLETVDELQPVMDRSELIQWIAKARSVHVEESIKAYIVDLIRGSRTHAQVVLGCSPRAAEALLAMSKATALLKDREYVIPEDVQTIAADVMSHRLIVKPEARYRGVTAREIVTELLDKTELPKS